MQGALAKNETGTLFDFCEARNFNLVSCIHLMHVVDRAWGWLGGDGETPNNAADQQEQNRRRRCCIVHTTMLSSLARRSVSTFARK